MASETDDRPAADGKPKPAGAAEARAAEAARAPQGRLQAAVNSIRASRPRVAAAAPPPAGDKSDASDAVPLAVRDRFVQQGRHYHFPDGERAFVDHGRRLTTRSENTMVIQSLIEIADARGWSEITVRGSERFRREAWSAARQADLAVRGYTPSEADRARLAGALTRVRAEREPSPAAPSEVPPESFGGEPKVREAARDPKGKLVTGRLLGHGRAPYQYQPGREGSYFVKLETPGGVRFLWGVDLERALRGSASRPEVGDLVGLRSLRSDAVTVRTALRDAEGRAVGEKDVKTHRNTWVVEKAEFFAGREAASRAIRDASLSPQRSVKAHPELAGSYLYLKAAEEVAKRKIRDPEDQRRFVDLVRSSLADSIARGEPLPAVRVRERVVGADRTAEREVGGARAF